MAQLYSILELCRAFDQVFKEHLDGARPGGEKIYGVFDNQFPEALKKLSFERHLSIQNVRKLINEADEAVVDAVHFILKELVRKSVGETRLPDIFRKLPQEIEKGGNPAASSLDRYGDCHLRRIGANVSSYVNMVCDTLRNSIPKAVVHCQVWEAKSPVGCFLCRAWEERGKAAC
ncbi:hypothetical protein L7F22_012783 [Adiantum nelumboides]|nr:hypothetical protein [Adiantum nelumboides]